MIAVLTGDIAESRNYPTPDVWLRPLKDFLLSNFGDSPGQWEILRGDSFQLRVPPEKSLAAGLRIKALIRGIGISDVRMSIGIGGESSRGKSISESYGDAYIYSGEGFEQLKSKRRNLLIQSPSEAFNREFDMMFRLLELVLNDWTTISAQTTGLVLSKPSIYQKELADELGISQPSVSARFRRAHIEEISELINYFESRVEELISVE